MEMFVKNYSHKMGKKYLTNLFNSPPPPSILYPKKLCKFIWGDIPKDGKKENVTSIFRKVKKEDPGNQRSVSFTLKVVERIILETISKHIWRTNRWLGAVSMFVWKGDHTWPTWWPSTMRWLPWWMKGEQRMPFISTSLSLLTLSPLMSSRQTDEIWTR